MNNNRVMVIRVPAELRQQWLSACQSSGRRSADLMREMVAAGLRYYSRNGNLYPPFELEPRPRTPEENLNQSTTGEVRHAADRLAVLRGQAAKRKGR